MPFGKKDISAIFLPKTKQINQKTKSHINHKQKL